MTMIYLEAMSYNISWGPVPWVSRANPILSNNAQTFLSFFFKPRQVRGLTRPTGVHERDFPVADPGGGRGHRDIDAVAVQLRVLAGYAARGREPRLAHLPHVRYLQFRPRCLRLVLHQGDQGALPRRDGGT